MSESRGFGEPVGRTTTVLVGLLLMAVSLPFLLLGVLGLIKSAWQGSGNDTLVLIVLSLLVGSFGCWTALRMILGKRRRDGGLLSPTVLRIGGVLFLVMPTILLFSGRDVGWDSVWMLLEIGFYLVAAAACFAIARRREFVTLGHDSFDEEP